MLNFPAFSAAVSARFAQMSTEELYVADVDTDLFTAYLLFFPEGTNPIFRTNTEHDCSCCKQFIRNVGAVVTADGGTVWDTPGLGHPYDLVSAAMAALVRAAPIKTVFRTKESKYGTPFNFDTKTEQRWDHFHATIATRHRSNDAATIRGQIESAQQVLRRGLDELKDEAIDTVIDLIDSNSLYRGAEHLEAVKAFRELKRGYSAAPDKARYVWSKIDDRAARFRNTVIGTLVTDLSESVELERAVRSFESKVAPQNYKRTSALITPRMIDEATSKLNELGLESAINRRHAKLSDVSVNDVLFVDNSVQSQMRDGLAGLLMEEVKAPKVDVKNATPISMDDFLRDVVPTASSISVLLENRHLGNFVSITAPVEGDTGRLFKWGNDFAWSYDGEVTDSIKQRVKAAGGKVDARFRVSLAWSNYDDLDLHCRTPRGHIYYGTRTDSSGGKLDVDMNISPTTREPVENIFWNGVIPDGQYAFSVNQFTKRESTNIGFELDFEFDGERHTYRYDKGLVARATFTDAIVVTVRNNRMISLDVNSGMIGGSRSTEKWGVTTETLVPVDTLMSSPNYWGGQTIGNLHWFFILKGCKNPDPVRGIYNEFLRGELEPHRKVFEVLGAKTKCPPADEQLSGVGFSSTRGDSVTVVVKGTNLNRAFNIRF